VFGILMAARALWVGEFNVSDPLKLLIGFALASGLGSSLGLIFMGLSQLAPFTERTRGPMLRPFFWVSGIFFTANHLSGTFRDVALMNPVLHAIEYVRDGWFVDYTAHHANPYYPLVWILGLTFFGMSLERVVRRRIELT
jgi:capsular polysaccharide transport system permease protein